MTKPCRIGITGLELEKVVRSARFGTQLGRAAQITQTTGHESAFQVLRRPESPRYTFGPVIEGLTDEVSYDSDYCRTRGSGRLEYDELVPLVDLHFHPGSSGCFGYSMCDVLLADGTSKFQDARPIVAVGSIGESRSGKLVCLQRRFSGWLKAAGSSFVSQVLGNVRISTDRLSDDALASAFSIGSYFHVGVLDFVLGNRGVAKIINPVVIHRFGYEFDPRRSVEAYRLD